MMASSNLVHPPSFSHLWWLMLRRSFELTLWLMGGVFCWIWSLCLSSLCSSEASPLELTALDVVLAVATGPGCLLAAWMLRRRGRVAEPGGLRGVVAERAVALVALPLNFPLATISRLPLMTRLLRARLEFTRDAIAIKWRFGERYFPYREIVHSDWQHDGVLISFRHGKSLLIPTCRPPAVTGPRHYPEIGHAVQTATFAVLRHNQNIAERICWECERVDGPGYRRAPRFAG